MSLLVLQGAPVQRLHEQLRKDESKTPLKKVSVYDSSGFKVYMHPCSSLWCTTYIVTSTNLIVLVQILTSSSKGFEDFVSFYMIYNEFFKFD